jgi:ribonuclease HII
VGLDEVGRGCLAGPVVAGAFAYPSRYDWPSDALTARVHDSKLLKAEQRRAALRELSLLPGAFLRTAHASVEEIDRLNILHASMLAMDRALDDVLGLIQEQGGAAAEAPVFVRVDGNRLPPRVSRLRAPHVKEFVIKGDSKSFAIAGAAIAAKEHRDGLMNVLAREYPAYLWNVNAGYPTPDHKDALRSHGFTPWHRRSFNPTL